MASGTWDVASGRLENLWTTLLGYGLAELCYVTVQRVWVDERGGGIFFPS